MKKKNDCRMKGSTILIVTIVMSVISLFCLTIWHATLLFYDTSFKKLEYEQKYQAAQGGLNYAILFCSKQYDPLVKSSKEKNQAFEIETEPWRISKNIEYRNKIYIKPEGDSLRLESLIFDSANKETLKISCNLDHLKTQSVIKELPGTFVIKNWSICDK